MTSVLLSVAVCHWPRRRRSTGRLPPAAAALENLVVVSVVSVGCRSKRGIVECRSSARVCFVCFSLRQHAKKKKNPSSNFWEPWFSCVERAFHPRHQVVPQLFRQETESLDSNFTPQQPFFFLDLFPQPPCTYAELGLHNSGSVAPLMASVWLRFSQRVPRCRLIAEHMNIHARRGAAASNWPRTRVSCVHVTQPSLHSVCVRASVYSFC